MTSPKCVHSTSRGNPCKLRAWWENGFCYIHAPKDLLLEDWLIGMARGAENNSLPGSVSIIAAVLYCRNSINRKFLPNNPILKDWRQTIPPPYPSSWIEGSPSILIGMGGESFYWKKDITISFRPGSPDLRSISLPEDAIVASDQMIEVIDTSASNLIYNQIHACVTRCEQLKKSIELGEKNNNLPHQYFHRNMRWNLIHAMY